MDLGENLLPGSRYSYASLRNSTSVAKDLVEILYCVQNDRLHIVILEPLLKASVGFPMT